MKNTKWIVIVVALGMMAATAAYLKDLKGRHLLGDPGVRVSHVPIYDEKHERVSDQSIVLPSTVLGIPSVVVPISQGECQALPKDTTFGRRFYHANGDNFSAQLGVVLMGRDHTSIHMPEYCLYAQDWTITNSEHVMLHMDRPVTYDLPMRKLTATRRLRNGEMVECFYVYWFVSGDKITDEEGSRLWSMWKTVLAKGKLERWAYISYFATCHPGEETGTFNRLKEFIRASAPEFQTVTGKASDGPPMVARK